ncbi:MAG: hypothetical protein Alpg2KO_15840 [Alphaproteobacteria bacterium]
MDTLTKVLRARRGASALTYGLLVGLISVTALVSVTSIGDNTDALFGTVDENLSGVAGTSGTASASPAPSASPSPVPCTATISGGTNVDLASQLISPCSWDGSSALFAEVTLAGTFTSASTSQPAVVVDFPSGSDITLLVTGTVQGAGGAGGAGGWQSDNDGEAGGNGGPALELRSDASINNSGAIWGGGGGGGGGGTAHLPNFYAGGAGGGGGAGSIPGAAGIANPVQYAIYALGFSGNAGGASTGGSGGASSSYGGYFSGAGGSGGGPGLPGATGGNGTGAFSGPGGAGGSAGDGVLENGGIANWISQGDVRPAP